MGLTDGRIVGVDFGARRTGIAVSDPLRLFAHPRGTFSPREALAELQRINATDGIELIVLGWPLAPDGEEGPAVERVRAYEREIRLALPAVTIMRWDERYTSAEAKELLIAAGVPKKRRSEKGRVDAAAAAVILQSYIDSNYST